MGTTCDRPPPAPPPLMPKTRPMDGSRRHTTVGRSLRARASARPIETVVLPSPKGVRRDPRDGDEPSEADVAPSLDRRERTCRPCRTAIELELVLAETEVGRDIRDRPERRPRASSRSETGSVIADMEPVSPARRAGHPSHPGRRSVLPRSEIRAPRRGATGRWRLRGGSVIFRTQIVAPADGEAASGRTIRRTTRQGRPSSMPGSLTVDRMTVGDAMQASSRATSTRR